MAVIWEEQFLSDLATDAENDAVQKCDYLFTRFSIEVTSGQSVYSLPSYVRKIERVTWKGYKVWPVSFREMCELNPATMVASESEKVEAGTGKPLYYALHPNNIRNIRFYPTPNETLAADDTKVWTTTGIDDICCISAYRSPDGSSNVLPDYLSRRTKKAYILQQAFLKEGKGQNLTASAYYAKKYMFQIELLKKINNGHFVSRRLRLSDALSEQGRRPARPVLPPNYPR
jgi:hypothetical protein